MKPMKHTALGQLIFNSFDGLSRDIWLLALMTLINRSGTMVILFLTIYLTTQFGYSELEAGFAMSAFGLGALCGAYIGGWLTDRIGYYPTMFWTLLVSGFGFFILMHITALTPFCIAVFVISSIGDSFRPANLAAIAAYSSPENHNRSLSLVRMAINLGFAIGIGAAGIISANFGYDWLFIIDGLTCIFGAIFFRLVMVEKKEVDPRKETVETESDEPLVSKVKDSPSAYRDSLFIFFAFIMFLNAMSFMQLFSTVPLYFTKTFGLTEDEFGYFMVINGILIVIFEMPLIYLLEKRYKRMDMIFLGAAMIGFSYLFLNLSGSWLLAVMAYIIFISFGEIINFPFSNAFALSRSTPDRRGEFMGLYSMSFAVAFIVSPTAGGYIVKNHGFSTLWYITAGISLLACIGFLIVKRLDQTQQSNKANTEKILDASVDISS